MPKHVVTKYAAHGDPEMEFACGLVYDTWGAREGELTGLHADYVDEIDCPGCLPFARQRPERPSPERWEELAVKMARYGNTQAAVGLWREAKKARALLDSGS